MTPTWPTLSGLLAQSNDDHHLKNITAYLQPTAVRNAS